MIRDSDRAASKRAASNQLNVLPPILDGFNVTFGLQGLHEPCESNRSLGKSSDYWPDLLGAYWIALPLPHLRSALCCYFLHDLRKCDD